MFLLTSVFLFQNTSNDNEKLLLLLLLLKRKECDIFMANYFCNCITIFANGKVTSFVIPSK